MITLLVVFTMKLADCTLSTLKTVLLVKDKLLASAICNASAAALFIFVADIMSNAPASSKASIALVIFLANFLGSYFPPKLEKKFSRDKVYLFIITPPSFSEGQIFADFLKENDIAVTTHKGYNKHQEKILTINAFSTTKEQSIIIENNMNDEYKYSIIEAV